MPLVSIESIVSSPLADVVGRETHFCLRGDSFVDLGVGSLDNLRLKYTESGMLFFICISLSEFF